MGNRVRTTRPASKGGRFPGRPVKGPSITDDLAKLRFCSPSSAKKSLERWRETCTDLTVIARQCPRARRYLSKTLAPLNAACAEPSPEDAIPGLTASYARNDAESDVLLCRWLESRSDADLRRFLASLRMERNSGAELEAALLARELDGAPC